MWLSLGFHTSKVNLQIFHVDFQAPGETDGQTRRYFTKARDYDSVPFLLGEKKNPSQPAVQSPHPPDAHSPAAHSPFLQMSARSFTCRAGGHGSRHNCCVPACQPGQPRGNGQVAGWAGKGWGRWLLKLKLSC